MSSRTAKPRNVVLADYYGNDLAGQSYFALAHIYCPF